MSEQFYLVKRKPSEYLEDLRELEDLLESMGAGE